MNTRICSVALIEKDGKILMGNKAPGVGPYSDTWRLPGGKIEEGETEEEALKREIMEEVSLKVVESKKIAVFEDDEPNKNKELTHYIFNIFRVKTEGEEKISDEFPEIKWIEKSRLKKYTLSRASIKLFKDLGYL